MKVFLWIGVLIASVPFSMKGEYNVRIYSEKENGEVRYYIDNNEWCPVSVVFDFELKNMKSSKGPQFTVVIPAQSSKYPVTTLKPYKENELYGFKYKTTIILGNVHAVHDQGYVYELPFPPGKTYKVFQGYNGRFSHVGQNALDFSMAVGDSVLAARSGVVVDVVQHNHQSCMDPGCEKFNNYILVYHEDGTFGEYAHIRKDGSLVMPGDSISAGCAIALSGDVGFTSGPHLHFIVYLPGKKGKKSVKTLFRTQNNTPEYLVEGASYYRTKNN